MTEAEQKVLNIASIARGVHGKGSDVYEALVEAKLMTRRTTAVRVSHYAVRNSNKKLIKIVNGSGKILLNYVFNPQLSDMEEF